MRCSSLARSAWPNWTKGAAAAGDISIAVACVRACVRRRRRRIGTIVTEAMGGRGRRGEGGGENPARSLAGNKNGGISR